MTGEGPLARARRDLMEAKQRVLEKDTPTHRRAVEDARAHLDYLLDTLPLPTPADTPTPTDPEGPVPHRPGPSVS